MCVPARWLRVTDDDGDDDEKGNDGSDDGCGVEGDAENDCGDRGCDDVDGASDGGGGVGRHGGDDAAHNSIDGQQTPMGGDIVMVLPRRRLRSFAACFLDIDMYVRTHTLA